MIIEPAIATIGPFSHTGLTMAMPLMYVLSGEVWKDRDVKKCHLVRRFEALEVVDLTGQRTRSLFAHIVRRGFISRFHLGNPGLH